MTHEEVRRARRAFVRLSHPDRGGDPLAFAEGLARFDRLLAGPHATRAPGQVRVTVVRRSPWHVRWLRYVSGRVTRQRRVH